MPPTGFTKVGRLSQLPDGEMMLAEVKGERILVCNIGGDICAVSEVCTHADGPLSDGYLTGSQVECPLHASVFDVTTGKLIDGPAADGLTLYEVVIEGDDICLGPEKL